MKVDKATLIHPRLVDSQCSMLQHAINRLKLLDLEVAVSKQTPEWPANWQPPPVPVIADQEPSLGPAMAVYSCLQYAADQSFKAILVTPIDMPDLEVEHLQRLKAAWAQMEASGVARAVIQPIVASFDHSFPQPLIGIYPTCFLDDMRQLIRSERRSLSGWLQQRETRMIDLPLNAKRNWNSPQD